VDGTTNGEPRQVVTLLWSLRDLARVARQVESRVAERFADAPAEPNLEATRRLLVVALDVIDRIGSLYGETGAGDDDDLEGALEDMFSPVAEERLEDGMPDGEEDDPENAETAPVAPHGRPAGPLPADETTRIGPLATIATMEIRERLQDLAGLDPGEDPLETLAHASHARGAFLRAAIALEKLVCAAEGLRPRLPSPHDLERALAIRAAYAATARALCEQHPDDDTPPPPECLAVAADAIGKLLACDLTRHIRIADRIALARMHRRLLAHLESPDPEDPGGLRVWQDLKGLFGMLLLVNNRQELREHDHEAARWLLERLPLSGPARLGEREMEVLALLADREPGLMVERPDLDADRVGALRRQLLRIARELAPFSRSPESAPAPA